MARGGPRPGAGRPKGKSSRRKVAQDEQEHIAKHGQPPALPENHILPLDYMLRVLNDPSASPDRKDRMAQLAAPFCHARADIKGGKKGDKQQAAEKVATGGRFSPSNAPKVVQIKKQG